MTRLHRTRLLFGDNGTQKLQNATVMVVGCGAVGSFAIEALARSGIGHLIVVDFDACQVLCASFDDKDHTEKWEFDDLETI